MGLRVGRSGIDSANGQAYVFHAVKTNDLITTDPEILGGTPVFKGTRVPVRTLFEYIENNYTLAEFVECFPSVSREAARALLERSESVLLPVA
jgi:uncharacterized protein (DUF433 family)